MNIENARLQSKLPTEFPQGIARRQLEWSRPSSNNISWAERLQAWGAKAVVALTQVKEPKVSQVMTEQGVQWRVYDPVGDRSHPFTTETEVRVWLEERYNVN